MKVCTVLLLVILVLDENKARRNLLHNGLVMCNLVFESVQCMVEPAVISVIVELVAVVRRNICS